MLVDNAEEVNRTEDEDNATAELPDFKSILILYQKLREQVSLH